MKNKPKVVLIQRIFAIYRKPVYDILLNSFQFFVLHAKGNNGISEIKTNYSLEIKQIKYSNKETNVFLIPFTLLFRLKPDIVIHEFAIGILSLPVVLLITKLFNKKFILWSHGYDRKKGFRPKESLTDKYRLWLIKKCDALILYGQEDKKLLSRYVNPNKVFVAQNTLDTQKLLLIKKELDNLGKIKLKSKWKLKNEFNIIFIGRLLKEKSPNLLIEIYEKLKCKGIKIGVSFVGDGELVNVLKEEVMNKGYQDDVVFYGTINDDKHAGELLYCSDMMVMPGYLGLSVNHAFCFNCPVLSFKQNKNGPFHSPEVEYVVNGETGFLIENHNVDDMVEQLSIYFNNIELQKVMKENIEKMVTENCSIENMTKGIINAINTTLYENITNP